MKTKRLLSIFILVAGIVVSAFIAANGASAQAPAAPAVNPMVSIRYPVPELGNCGSETECKTYCDDSAHLGACLSFAQAHNLMSANEIQMAKKFSGTGAKGPGGCTSKDNCETYCNNTDNINECVAFAEQNNLMPKEQLAEAKKVQAAIASGIKPPACGGKQACDKYCQDTAHVEECMAFAKAAGFMTPEEAKNSDKVIAAIKKGVKPPACRGSECDKYCAEPAHTEECIAFSEAAGFMTSQEAGIARKTGGKGPGGCVGKEQCDAFCNNTDNQETCFSFGKDNGLIPPDQLQKMEEGKMQFTESLKQAPAQVLTCISGVVGADSLEKFKNGTLLPPRDIGDKVGECFRQGMPPGGPGEGGNIPPAGGSSGQNSQQRMKDYFSSIPPEVLDCLTSSVGADVVEKMKTGSVTGRKAGDPINQCFQKFGVEERTPNQNQPGQEQSNQQNQQIQPWADMCKNNTALACVDGSGNFVSSAKVGSDGKPVCPENSTAKCGNYQMNNQQGQGQGQGQGQDQKGQFQPGPGNTNPGGQMMPQQAGPGGCKTPEECQSFCQTNPDVCKNFKPSGGSQQGGQNQNNRREMMSGGQPGQIQGGTPGEFKDFIEGAAGKIMEGIRPGGPTQGQTPACAPGTQCPQGPNIPGQVPAGQPGTSNQNQPGSFAPGTGPGQIQQFQLMRPGVPEGGTPPPGVIMQPGTTGGPATQQVQQQQQQQQQFQSPPPPGGGGTPPQSGVVGPPPAGGSPTPPPPAGGSPTPPPPAGGSLIQSIQSFFGF
ncbi:hypothetical protein D4R51_02315 [bacterium]|nr:MAG: hypothetical protein D4R51_02315 [bacterium]